jgi:hypothetical protein
MVPEFIGICFRDGALIGADIPLARQTMGTAAQDGGYDG